MLTSVHIENFKSLVNVDVHLAPGVNVLVGPNGSGKSNFLRALQFLVTPGIPFEQVVSRAGGHPHVLAQTRDGQPFRSPERGFGGKPRNVGPTLPNAVFFDLAAAALRKPAALGAKVLGEDGSRLGSYVDYLQNEKPGAYAGFVDAVRRHAPEVRRILSPSVGSEKVVGIEDVHGQVFKADELADGMLFLLAITAVCFGLPPGPKVVCIEEPERGVHPWRLKGIVEQFRKLADDGAQVILTTHSDLIVNEFRDFPESIHLFDLVDGQTKVTRMSDHPGYEDAVRDSVPGSLWLTGMYGAVPR